MLVFPGLGLKAGMLSEQTWRLRVSVEQHTLLANLERVNTFLRTRTVVFLHGYHLAHPNSLCPERGFDSRSQYFTGVHADGDQGGNHHFPEFFSQSCEGKSECDFDSQRYRSCRVTGSRRQSAVHERFNRAGHHDADERIRHPQHDFRSARFIPVEGHLSGRRQLSPSNATVVQVVQ